jgi:hypothetical protein
MLWRAPFWRQFLVVWVTSALLVAALAGIDRTLGGPAKFFWLIPYPNSAASVLRMLRSVFSARPLLATAVAIPVVALVVTIALAALHVVRLVTRAS